MAKYSKPVKLLFRDMISDMSITKGHIVERDKIIVWFKANYPLIKTGTISAHLIKLSTNAKSRTHYNLDLTGKDDLLFQIDSKRFRLYDNLSDPAPIYSKPQNDETISSDQVGPDDETGNEFAYEKDLQNFIAKNLTLIEPGLTLYVEDEINGIEFPVGNRFIDILAIDRNGGYVVIELKVSRGYDRVVGQLLRYTAWIRKNQAEDTQTVRGIILAREISDDLILACSETTNVELFEYKLSVSLKRIEQSP